MTIPYRSSPTLPDTGAERIANAALIVTLEKVMTMVVTTVGWDGFLGSVEGYPAAICSSSSITTDNDQSKTTESDENYEATYSRPTLIYRSGLGICTGGKSMA